MVRGEPNFQVCTGTHKETGEVVAIKQLRKKAIKKEKVLEEINILRLVGDHQNIIGFKDLFVNEEYWFIVMEMAQGGELFDRLVQKVRMGTDDSSTSSSSSSSSSSGSSTSSSSNSNLGVYPPLFHVVHRACCNFLSISVLLPVVGGLLRVASKYDHERDRRSGHVFT
jgi:serine/threonine protein kinase